MEYRFSTLFTCNRKRSWPWSSGGSCRTTRGDMRAFSPRPSCVTTTRSVLKTTGACTATNPAGSSNKRHYFHPFLSASACGLAVVLFFPDVSQAAMNVNLNGVEEEVGRLRERIFVDRKFVAKRGSRTAVRRGLRRLPKPVKAAYAVSGDHDLYNSDVDEDAENGGIEEVSDHAVLSKSESSDGKITPSSRDGERTRSLFADFFGELLFGRRPSPDGAAYYAGRGRGGGGGTNKGRGKGGNYRGGGSSTRQAGLYSTSMESSSSFGFGADLEEELVEEHYRKQDKEQYLSWQVNAAEKTCSSLDGPLCKDDRDVGGVVPVSVVAAGMRVRKKPAVLDLYREEAVAADHRNILDLEYGRFTKVVANLTDLATPVEDVSSFEEEDRPYWARDYGDRRGKKRGKNAVKVVKKKQIDFTSDSAGRNLQHMQVADLSHGATLRRTSLSYVDVESSRVLAGDHVVVTTARTRGIKGGDRLIAEGDDAAAGNSTSLAGSFIEGDGAKGRGEMRENEEDVEQQLQKNHELQQYHSSASEFHEPRQFASRTSTNEASSAKSAAAADLIRVAFRGGWRIFSDIDREPVNDVLADHGRAAPEKSMLLAGGQFGSIRFSRPVLVRKLLVRGSKMHQHAVISGRARFREGREVFRAPLYNVTKTDLLASYSVPGGCGSHLRSTCRADADEQQFHRGFHHVPAVEGSSGSGSAEPSMHEIQLVPAPRQDLVEDHDPVICNGNGSTPGTSTSTCQNTGTGHDVADEEAHDHAFLGEKPKNIDKNLLAPLSGPLRNSLAKFDSGIDFAQDSLLNVGLVAVDELSFTAARNVEVVALEVTPAAYDEEPRAAFVLSQEGTVVLDHAVSPSAAPFLMPLKRVLEEEFALTEPDMRLHFLPPQLMMLAEIKEEEERKKRAADHDAYALRGTTSTSAVVEQEEWIRGQLDRHSREEEERRPGFGSQKPNYLEMLQKKSLHKRLLERPSFYKMASIMREDAFFAPKRRQIDKDLHLLDSAFRALGKHQRRNTAFWQAEDRLFNEWTLFVQNFDRSLYYSSTQTATTSLASAHDGISATPVQVLGQEAVEPQLAAPSGGPDYREDVDQQKLFSTSATSTSDSESIFFGSNVEAGTQNYDDGVHHHDVALSASSTSYFYEDSITRTPAMLGPVEPHHVQEEPKNQHQLPNADSSSSTNFLTDDGFLFADHDADHSEDEIEEDDEFLEQARRRDPDFPKKEVEEQEQDSSEHDSWGDSVVKRVTSSLTRILKPKKYVKRPRKVKRARSKIKSSPRRDISFHQSSRDRAGMKQSPSSRPRGRSYGGAQKKLTIPRRSTTGRALSKNHASTSDEELGDSVSDHSGTDASETSRDSISGSSSPEGSASGSSSSDFESDEDAVGGVLLDNMFMSEEETGRMMRGGADDSGDDGQGVAMMDLADLLAQVFVMAPEDGGQEPGGGPGWQERP
ncbi:unnamed protein product [Amoebophrya sp. A120]|nr:unnamed protein product [Amoebophrya sp. A120]|eukprot:GSA120T00003293001.1